MLFDKCLAIMSLISSIVGTAGLTKSDDADSCHLFAGGTVYPAEAAKGDHTLKTTKAVSKFLLKNS